MDLGLSGKAFLVTGGSRGLGLATARSLLAEGANVTLVGRDAHRLATAAASVGVLPGDVHSVSGDVTSAADATSIIQAATERWGRLDGLVNAAGRHSGAPFTRITDDEWSNDFQARLLAHVRMTRLALPHLERTGGAVLNVLSIWARFQAAGALPSSAFRAAGLAVTGSLAKEVAPVRVNAILVGFVESVSGRIEPLVKAGPPTRSFRRWPLIWGSRWDARAAPRSSETSPHSCSHPARPSSAAQP